MSDQITDEERHLIDVALAAGRVTRVAAGVRALAAPDAVYNPTRRTLVYTDQEAAKKRLIRGVKWGRPTRKQ